MPLPDYYQALGVSPSATIEEIKKAYRRLAFHNHPDRGGSHERMLAINEAFYVLADPAARAAHDQARLHQADAEAGRRAEQYSAKAASAAGDYPRNYQEFEGWVDGFIRDVSKAEYGSDRLGPIPMPTVKNSDSGILFLVIGGVGGLFVWYKMGWSEMEASYAAALVMGGSVAGGAWFGQLVHACLKGAVTSSQPACAGNTESRTFTTGSGTVEKQLIVACPKCSQKLRAGISRVGAQLRCPQCGTEFRMR